MTAVARARVGRSTAQRLLRGSSGRLEIEKLSPPAERGAGKIVGQGKAAVPELVRLLRQEAKVV